MTDFVHLHVHSEYSLLDGAARLKDMFAEAKAQGMRALAMTDHGNLHGAYDFFTQGQAAGVKPIIGIEAYVAPGHRSDQERVQWGTPEQKRYDVSGRGAYTHMTMLATNKTGLHNLFKLSSRSYSEGLLGKYPRMDAELVAEHAEGLIGTTGCPGGAVMTRLNLGQYEEAVAEAAKWREIFGKDNFFLEIMDHGLEIERRVRDDLYRLGQRLGLTPVVTNDSHYTRVEEAAAHDALLCVQTGSTLYQEDRFRFEGEGYYLKSAAEMAAIDSSPIWEWGMRTTLEIADRVDTTGMFEFQNLMPRFPVPEGQTEGQFFREQVLIGMDRRFPGGYDDEHRTQVEYEIDMINQMGFPSYFLVVADFIGWAKENGVWVGPGRGSAAGSLAAYALGITDLDPIPHGLIFERFLNPERVSMPDVDIDFDDRRRGDVIRYVTEKYGSDKVAQIATYGRIKARNAMKDAARVLDKPFQVGEKLTKAYPADVMGASMPLEGITNPEHPRYDEAGEIRALYENDKDAKEVIDLARGLEGLVRQMGVHAAGVIMSDEPLVDHIPVWVRPADGATITQFDYPSCEALGLLKMDFLGLRNLTIMGDAVENIRRNRGEHVDIENIPLDDPATYELLTRGDTLSVFQLDGGAMRSLLRLLKPDQFEDISAVVALYRPGPMGMGSHTNYALRKNGQQEITPIHPEVEEPLAEILDPTFGLIIYQEQVQKAAQILAGYTLGQADLLRRAMGKKKPEVLAKEFVNFQKGASERGYSDAAIRAVWDVLVPFAGYAFNKAHSAAYGLIAYRTAYLKTHYPAEYMAAVLTSVGDDKNKMATYLGECRRMGLRVLPPDVSVSNSSFTPNGEREIRFGLTAVKNVGESMVEEIVQLREAWGKFTSLPDFLRSATQANVSKRAVESLIKAGAFDSTGATRKGMAEQFEALVDHTDLSGTPGLFVPAGTEPIKLDPLPDWDRGPLLSIEREMLGLYVSDHPLAGIGASLRAQATHSVADVLDEHAQEGATVRIGVLVANVDIKTNKRGQKWAVAELEDQTGSVECAFFAGSYGDVKDTLVQDAIVFVTGRLEYRDGSPQLIGMSAQVAQNLEVVHDGPVVIELPVTGLNDKTAPVLAQILDRHPGETEVFLRLVGPGVSQYLRVGKYQVTRSKALAAELHQFSQSA
ncbi:DnaE-like DNA polymerase III alpha [Streptomyces phage Leviticus]|uniref:DNA polymerase III subunit alpha n=1 Tax=Streptomyces phage Leviticus TaxID=2593357 RepID=A0A514U383_9CAUD|nr:DnaE-like DNA polymerase III alpha [Streptomyces phage Leviticus]